MAASYANARSGAVGGPLAVRDISTADLREALRKGVADFQAMPSHVAFVSLIYPILGLFFASVAFGYDVVPLIYPLISGFALVGPLAAVGLYELSRRRELGLETHWSDAFDVLKSPAIGSIVAMGLVLIVAFFAWMFAAQAIFRAFYGTAVDTMSYSDLARDILTTSRGWGLIVVGNLVGGLFAVVVLAVSVMAFPLILDRNVGVGTAIQTSIRAVTVNPVNMAIWGAIVAGLLAIGSLPLFVGLAVVVPILGHATWHLYKSVIIE